MQVIVPKCFLTIVFNCSPRPRVDCNGDKPCTSQSLENKQISRYKLVFVINISRYNWLNALRLVASYGCNQHVIVWVIIIWIIVFPCSFRPTVDCDSDRPCTSQSLENKEISRYKLVLVNTDSKNNWMLCIYI